MNGNPTLLGTTAANPKDVTFEARKRHGSGFIVDHRPDGENGADNEGKASPGD